MVYQTWDGKGDVYDWLQSIQANPRRTSNGWSIRCLNTEHEDRNNSAKLFDDGWWACFGACGRHHIQPSSKGKRFSLLGADGGAAPSQEHYEPKTVQGTVDYFDYWLSLEPLVDGIKGLPASHLNSLGWRQLPDDNILGQKGGIFIPYFSVGRNQILFYQVRHLEGDRRFSFTPGVTPTANGYESLAAMGKYLPFTEGASDRAVLEYLGIPTIGLPSASSGTILKGLAKYAKDNHLVAVACTDNDDAGDKLLSALDGVSTYIDLRPPAPYKDFGEMYEAKGPTGVKNYLRLLAPKAPKQPERILGMEVISEEEFKREYPKSWHLLFN